MGRHSRTGHMTSCTGIEFENLATLKGYSAPTRQFDWVSRNGCFRRYFAVGARVGEGPESTLNRPRRRYQTPDFIRQRRWFRALCGRSLSLVG